MAEPAGTFGLILDMLGDNTVNVDVSAPENFLPGLGTRHAAGASVSRTTSAIAVVVSQSSVVRVFADGDLRAEIIPELFLLSRERLFTRGAEVTQMPNSTVSIDAEQGQKLLKLIDALQDHDDVQAVSHNAEIPESVMA